MTRSRHTQASLTDLPALRDAGHESPLDGSALDEASRRAWTRAMTVRPFGDAYLVDCEDDTHFVRLAPSTCSCGADAADDHCAHVRRVAIEINLGRVPPPAERAVPCQGCDRPVAVSAADDPPALCSDCHLEPGDVVVDAEGDPDVPLLVVSEPGRPAAFAPLPDDGTVAAHPANGAYPPDQPVVEAVYPQAVSTDREPRRYRFPLARLREPDPDPRPPERDDESGPADRTDADGALG